MEALVIEPRTKSDARFLRSVSKRIGAEIIEPVDLLVDRAMRRLKEEDLLDPNVSESAVRKALKDFAVKRRFSAHVIGVDDFLEEYEDTVFGRMMKEAMNDPENGIVSEEEIMEALRS